MRLIHFLPIFLLLAGCAPANLKELRCEGEEQMKKLTGDLKKIETIEDVQKGSKKLKKHFNRIGELLIETRHFPPPAEPEGRTAAGEALFAELARVYEIPGARSLIETAQSEAVHRLDRSKRVSK
jgi:hypothetical protein